MFVEQNSDTGWDIGVLSMDGEPAVTLLMQTEFREVNGGISPDGRWIVYQSNRSGLTEVYVERFPELGGRQKISTGGGNYPHWSPDGRELFYRSIGGRQVLAVPVELEPVFTLGIPVALFEGDYVTQRGGA